MKETATREKVCGKNMYKIIDKNSHYHKQIQMMVEIDEGKMKEIIECIQLCQLIKEQEEEEPGIDHEEDDQYLGFPRILDHQSPLRTGEPDFNGLKFNLLV